MHDLKTRQMYIEEALCAFAEKDREKLADLWQELDDCGISSREEWNIPMNELFSIIARTLKSVTRVIPEYREE